ncbi:MAG TPA: Gfo/Idh/MocA family oxidoreductase [Opitutaceae bacterium]|nr:Gfo/Idh/MocA family oxidoreductase [Opitutaceae bacterium]
MTPSQANPAIRRRPIVLIGAGGIVKDAHLPAYRSAGFPVAGIFDLDASRARALAEAFAIPRVYGTLAEAVQEAPEGAAFDVAVPAPALAGVLPSLPEGAPALLQKPLGENLAQARILRDLCRSRRLKAAVNFQLRFAPNVAEARRLIAAGAIGEVHDLEVRVTVYTPWQLWTFLEKAPRVEILYHSIHYVDLVRSFFGEPSRAHALTVRHPLAPKLAATRTALALGYGDSKRATITANHGHAYGREHQESYVKWEGTEGALVAKLGVNLNYPAGEPDTLEICRLSAGQPPRWRPVPVEGNWFPHAFAGSMASLLRHADGAAELPTAVEDACRTMAVVEAAYADSASGGTPVPAP